MTSRERVRRILNHKEADKLAIDCGAMHSSGMSAMTYNALKKHLGMPQGETKVYDVIQQLIIPEQWFLDRFSIDTVDLAREFSNDPADWVDWPLPDGSPGLFPAWIDAEKNEAGDWFLYNNKKLDVAEMRKGMFYFDQTRHPMYGKNITESSNLKEILNDISWTTLKDPLFKNENKEDFYPSIGRAAKKLYEETDYSLIANYSSLVFENSAWVYRNDEFYVKLISDPKEVTLLFEKFYNIHMEILPKFLEQVGPYCDVLIMSDDLGMQTGPLLSPKMYRELVFPWHKKIFDYVKSKTNMKTFLHTCGSIFDIIPHLIEAGLDIMNPVQTNAFNMDAKKLKDEYGKDMVFWGGGVETQHVLASGTPDEVKDNVKKNCEILAKDGGFIFNQIHNMLPGIPPENIIAMFEAANNFRY